MVDPSANLTATADTWVQDDTSSSKWTSTELRAGTFDSGTTRARSLLKFNTSSLTGKIIITANLYLWEFHSYSCTAKQLNVYRVTSAFNSSTIWSNQPGTGSLAGSVTAAKGYSGSCPDGWINIQIPGLVQAWADGTYTNDGSG